MAAFKSTMPFHEKAKALLEDPERDFLATSLVELELTQPQFNPRNKAEADFYTDYIQLIVTETTPITEELIRDGLQTIRKTEASALDAMHITCALRMNADEFITTEAKGKPMYRESRIPIIFLGDL